MNEKLSVVVPVYNEECILESALRDLLADMSRMGIEFEVVVAENGSIDSTLDIARKLADADSRVRVLHLDPADYGRAMRLGFLEASGDRMVNFSIDFMDLEFLQTALSLLDGHDLVLGSKYVSKGYDRRPLSRRLGGMALSSFVRVLFGLPISDTHGLLAMNRQRMVPLVKRCRFGNEIFDTELIVRAHRAGMRICEAPVRAQEVRPSRIGAFARARRMLGQYVRLRMVLWREGMS